MKTKELVVGNFSVKPGEKRAVTQEFMVCGSSYELPMFIINGKNNGPTLIVTGGIHAAEYASEAAALEVGQNLNPQELNGQVIIIPVVNVEGFKMRSIYVNPMDGVNLNRVFPGKSDGCASEQIAHWVFQNAISKGDCFVDMHGGDLVEALIPFTIFHRSGNEKVDKASLEIAKAFGIPYLVASDSLGSTFSAASEAGIPGILTEAGGQGIWTRQDVLLHVNGLNRLMKYLGILQGPPPEAVDCKVLEKFIWMSSEFDGYYYPVVNVGDSIQKGQFLGKITDFEGNVLQKVEAPEAGVVLFLVTCLAINKNNPLLSIGA
jgi:predicted deacylase